MITIAVVDEEPTTRPMIAKIFGHAGYRVETFADGRSFLERMESEPFDIVFLDMRLPDMEGMDILSHIKNTHRDTEVIIVTGDGTLDNAVEATKAGAFHYLTKPFRSHDLRLLATRASEKIHLHRENVHLKSRIDNGALIPGFIGTSKAMRAIFDTIVKVAQVNCNVLLEAETGTGKQLTARAIHELGGKKDAPFVYFNCGGFAEDLICSELFGHERGAFTGAVARKIGLLESAAGGTVLLDEIGEMPLSMQVKLLHVLQERQILRVGGTRPVDLNIRIIAATNKNLKELVRKDAFREDLYYRLNVVTIRLPRLHERREDIPLLIHHFIAKANAAFDKSVQGVSHQAMNLLLEYGFPGNVRELENIIQHAVALTEGQKITPEDLPPRLRRLCVVHDPEATEMLSMEEMERRHIARVLAATEYNIKAASQILKISRTTLWRRIRKFGLKESAG